MGSRLSADWEADDDHNGSRAVSSLDILSLGELDLAVALNKYSCRREKKLFPLAL